MVQKSLILLLLWLPQALRQLLIWIYWIQIKEYRFDRFKLILSSFSGRKNLELELIIVKVVVFFLMFLLNERFITLIFILTLFDINIFIELLKRSLRRPVFTQRAVRIFIPVIVFSVIPLLIGAIFGNLNPIHFIISEILLVCSIPVGVISTIPIVNKIRDEEAKKAKGIIEKIKPMIIGITGSYGKSSTKDFIAQMLLRKYKVLKTAGNQNTEFGIARRINNFLDKGTKFFVAEMGAYKIGEIKNITDIARPNLAIITGIEEQHLSLFGSLENIKKAKFEIIEALPKGGIAIFNYSNTFCRDLAEKARTLPNKPRVLGYRTFSERKDRLDIKADIVSRVLSINPSTITIKVKMGKEMHNIKTSLPGQHFVENLTAAILVARYFRIPWKDINKVCAKIELPDDTMKVLNLKSGAIVIDDTHNSTPKAFESALEYLELFKNKKKIIITGGIIELGNKSEEIHEYLGRKMADSIEQIVLTNPDYFESLKKGLGKNSGKTFLIKNSKELSDHFDKFVSDSETVVLLEGRLPSSIIERLNLKL